MMVFFMSIVKLNCEIAWDCLRLCVCVCVRAMAVWVVYEDRWCDCGIAALLYDLSGAFTALDSLSKHVY